MLNLFPLGKRPLLLEGQPGPAEGPSNKQDRVKHRWHMHSIAHWFLTYANFLAILVTVGVAVLLVCCLECSKCPRREKDDLFKHHEV